MSRRLLLMQHTGLLNCHLEAALSLLTEKAWMPTLDSTFHFEDLISQ